MMQSTITVVTCTIGDSARRLERLLSELHAFTSIDFRHIISDDGTLTDWSNDDMVGRQRQVCAQYDNTLWTQLQTPPWGISYNFNYGLGYVETPWAFLVEDGLRPPRAWLEIALDIVEKIGNRSWNGRRVGMAGCHLLEDWTLAAGGAIPGGLTVQDFYRQTPQSYDAFYGPWNDGLWCWPRLMPGFLRTLQGDTSSWTDDLVGFREVFRPKIENWDERLNETEQQQRWQKWHSRDRWPQYRRAGCGWYPGPVLLLNMELWRSVGRMRNGCTFFEGHLGTRMGINGHLSLVVETPPFLHQRSQGFRMCHLAAEPRDHRDTTQVFLEDFGHNHMDAPNVLANAVVSLAEQADIGRQLMEVELDLPEVWRPWM